MFLFHQFIVYFCFLKKKKLLKKKPDQHWNQHHQHDGDWNEWSGWDNQHHHHHHHHQQHQQHHQQQFQNQQNQWHAEAGDHFYTPANQLSRQKQEIHQHHRQQDRLQYQRQPVQVADDWAQFQQQWKAERKVRFCLNLFFFVKFENTFQC